MELIDYLELNEGEKYLKKMPIELLTSIYDFIDINLNPLIKKINSLKNELTDEEIYNYFYKYKSFIHRAQLGNIYTRYCERNNGEKYKIPFSHNIINCALDYIKIIQLHYVPLDKLEKSYFGIDYSEIFWLNDLILNDTYIHKKINLWNYVCKDTVKKDETYTDSVLLSVMYLNYNYNFNNEVKIKFLAKCNTTSVVKF